MVVFNEKENYMAYLEYGRRFRDSYSFQARSMITTEVGIIADFKKGKYKSDPATLEQKLKEFNDNLLDGITELNGQPVPNRLKGSHLLVCRGYRLAYEASLALSEAAGAEGVERSNQLKFAESKAQAAWKAVRAGLAEHQHIWSTTGTSIDPTKARVVSAASATAGSN